MAYTLVFLPFYVTFGWIVNNSYFTDFHLLLIVSMENIVLEFNSVSYYWCDFYIDVKEGRLAKG